MTASGHGGGTFEPTETLGPPRLVGGKYRLGRLIGQGAMGAVYEAEHVELGARVAVKLLGESFAFDEVVAERARREGRAAAAIGHDSIVSVIDSGVDEGVPYLVMELLEGESLGALLRRELTLDERRAAAILCEVLAGLAAAHARGVLHRDLKPDNIYLARGSSGAYRVKILDFGVSKLTGPGVATLTEAGVALGTPHYMAPEQVARRSDVDGRVDLYAAGVVLYRMLTGRLPFAGVAAAARDAAIESGSFPAAREIAPAISPAVAEVIDRAMATDREQRFADAESFRAALDAAVPGAAAGLAGLEAEATASAVAARTQPPRPRRRVGPRAVVIAAALVVAAAAGVLVATGLFDRGPASPAAEPAAAPQGDALRFGVATYVPREVQERLYGPLAAHLAAAIDRPVELRVTRDSAELVRAFHDGGVHVAALNPLAYVRARRAEPGLHLLATPVTAGGASFEVHIVARADSGIDSSAELEDRSFCYVPSAASGYAVPRTMLRRAGLDPDRDLAATHLVADHLSALRYVDSGVCDATAVYASLLFEAGEHGLNPYAFRILDTSDRIPNDAYCASAALDEGEVEALRAALLALEPGSAAAAEVFADGGEILGFRSANDADYDSMRAAEAEEGRAGTKP